MSPDWSWTVLVRGREPPDAMSLCYANTSLQDLLGRPSPNPSPYEGGNPRTP